MFRNILQAKWVTMFLIAIIVFLGFSIYKNYLVYRAISLETGNLKNKIAEVKRQTGELSKLNENSENQAFLERQIKQKLNFKRPDENVVFIYKNPYNQKANENTEFVTDQTASSSISIWQKIISWFEKL